MLEGTRNGLRWGLGLAVFLLTTLPANCSVPGADAKMSQTDPLVVWNRDFGITSYMFSGEWRQRAYQATIHIRPVCQGDSTKHVRLLINFATAPHPYFMEYRQFCTPVLPLGWFTDTEGGMPRIWFQNYGSKDQVTVKQFVGEQELEGRSIFDREDRTQGWIGTADLKQGKAYVLHVEGSERSYQAVLPGPCPPAHPMFWGQLPGMPLASTGSHLDKQAPTEQNNGNHVVSNGPVWLAPVQKVVFAQDHMAYIVRQHLEYHMRLGMAGMLLACDHFVCLELLQDPALASRAQEGRLVLWAWAHGHERGKPQHKLNIATNLMRMAAYGTPALFTFYDLDEFMVIPSGQPITTLLAAGGCLAGVRKHAQALIRSNVAVAKNWRNADPRVTGELPAWLEYDVWVDALEAMNYSMAPQGFLGWKAIVDPNSDYNFNCHDHVELSGWYDIPQVNFVDEDCAYNMHFTDWFENRAGGTENDTVHWSIRGTKGDLIPLQQSQIAVLRSVYETRRSPVTTASAIGDYVQPYAPVHAAAGHPYVTTAELILPGADAANAQRHAPRVVSITLITGRAEILLGDALSSVDPFVDACLVVYPSSFDSPKLSLRAAAEAVGDKLIVQQIEPAGLAEMLNVSLAWARKLGAEWGVVLEPDQKVLNSGKEDLLTVTAHAVQSGATQLNCYHDDIAYLQAFMVKLSAGGGFIHDQYVQPHGGEEAGLPGCSITRPAKTKEWQQRRAKQAIQAVHAAGEAISISQAAWFVLAEAQWSLGEQKNATEAWQKCVEFEQSPQLAALCGYRLALLAAHNKAVTGHQVVEALRHLVDMHGCSPELCWFAALTAYRAGEYKHAKDWALQSVQTGCYVGSCMPEGRIRNHGARHESPYDVLHFALMQLGDAKGAEQARQNYAQALVAKRDAEQAEKPASAKHLWLKNRAVAIS